MLYESLPPSSCRVVSNRRDTKRHSDKVGDSDAPQYYRFNMNPDMAARRFFWGSLTTSTLVPSGAGAFSSARAGWGIHGGHQKRKAHRESTWKKSKTDSETEEKTSTRTANTLPGDPEHNTMRLLVGAMRSARLIEQKSPCEKHATITLGDQNLYPMVS